MTDFEVVVGKVQQLYDPATSPSARSAVSQELQTFASHPSAWRMLFALLTQAPNAQVSFFAALSLRNKVRRSLGDLGKEFVVPMWESLVGALRQYRDGPKETRVALCVALAAAGSSPHSPEDGVTQLCRMLGSDAVCLVELLQAMGDEASRLLGLTEESEQIVRRRMRLQASLQEPPPALTQQGSGPRMWEEAPLVKSVKRGGAVLEALEGILQAHGPSPALLNCFATWVPFHSQSAALPASPFIRIVIAKLCDEELCQEACEALTNLLKYASPQSPIETLVIREMTTLVSSGSGAPVPDGVLLALCTFVKCRPSFFLPPLQLTEAMAEGVLCRVSEAFGKDCDLLASAASEAWGEIRSVHGGGNKECGEVLRKGAVSMFTVACSVAALCDVEDILEEDRYSHHRESVIGPVCQEVYEVEGGSACLSAWCGVFDAALREEGWRKVEAALFVLFSASPSLQAFEVVGPHLLPIFPKLLGNPYTLLVGLRLVQTPGMLRWLQIHKDTRLQGVIDMIVHGLQTRTLAPWAGSLLHRISLMCSEALISQGMLSRVFDIVIQAIMGSTVLTHQVALLVRGASELVWKSVSPRESFNALALPLCSAAAAIVERREKPPILSHIFYAVGSLFEQAWSFSKLHRTTSWDGAWDSMWPLMRHAMSYAAEEVVQGVSLCASGLVGLARESMPADALQTFVEWHVALANPATFLIFRRLHFVCPSDELLPPLVNTVICKSRDLLLTPPPFSNAPFACEFFLFCKGIMNHRLADTFATKISPLPDALRRNGAIEVVLDPVVAMCTGPVATDLRMHRLGILAIQDPHLLSHRPSMCAAAALYVYVWKFDATFDIACKTLSLVAQQAKAGGWLEEALQHCAVPEDAALAFAASLRPPPSTPEKYEGPLMLLRSAAQTAKAITQ